MSSFFLETQNVSFTDTHDPFHRGPTGLKTICFTTFDFHAIYYCRHYVFSALYLVVVVALKHVWWNVRGSLLMAPGFPCQKITALRSHLHKLHAMMCPVTNGKFSILVPAVEVGIFVSFNGSNKGE